MCVSMFREESNQTPKFLTVSYGLTIELPTLMPNTSSLDIHWTGDGQETVLPLVVVKTELKAPPLLGRTWLAEIQLDWPQIMSHGEYAISTDIGSLLQDKYAEVFKEELGTVKEFRATLHVKEDVVPVFHKARMYPTPYALLWNKNWIACNVKG